MPRKTSTARQIRPLSPWVRCEGLMTCGEASEPLAFEAHSAGAAEAVARNLLQKWLGSLMAEDIKGTGWAPPRTGSFRVQFGAAVVTGTVALRVEVDHVRNDEENAAVRRWHEQELARRT